MSRTELALPTSSLLHQNPYIIKKGEYGPMVHGRGDMSAPKTSLDCNTQEETMRKAAYLYCFHILIDIFSVSHWHHDSAGQPGLEELDFDDLYKLKGSTLKQSTADPAHIPKGYTQAISSMSLMPGAHELLDMMDVDDFDWIDNKVMIAPVLSFDGYKLRGTVEYHRQYFHEVLMECYIQGWILEDLELKLLTIHRGCSSIQGLLIGPQRPKKVDKSIWVKKRSTVGSQAVLHKLVKKAIQRRILKDLLSLTVDDWKDDRRQGQVITCLVAKATEDEVSYGTVDWGHGQLKIINKLVKAIWLGALPSKTFKLVTLLCGIKKNRILIEAARSMLADSLYYSLGEACAILEARYERLNEWLVTKPQLKTLMKFLYGKFLTSDHMKGRKTMLIQEQESLVIDAEDLDASNSMLYTPHIASRGTYAAKEVKLSSEDQGGVADYIQTWIFIDVPSTPTLRIHKIHPQSQIIGKSTAGVQTRRKLKDSTSNQHQALLSFIYKQNRTNHKDQQTCLFACFLSQEEPKKVSQALADESWVEAMQEELLQFKLQEVWVLCDLPEGKRVIGTKWVFRNKRDERGTIIKNKARLVAQGYRQEEGVDYDEV
ncbi:putative ribonuclease H-like domain-containing protein, partial [Tanacetum coccineum]